MKSWADDLSLTCLFLGAQSQVLRDMLSLCFAFHLVSFGVQDEKKD